MKPVAIGLAILAFVVLSVLVLTNHIQAASAAARMSALERSQTEQSAQIKAEVAALAAVVERLNAELESDSGAQRAALSDIARTLSSLERREVVRTAAAAVHPPQTAPLPQPARVPAPPVAEQDLRLQDSVRQAAALYRSGSYHAARERAAAALALEPGNAQARLLHGLSRYRENPADSSAHARVEADLLAFADGADADPEALRVLGSVAIEQGRWELARERLARAAALRPANAEDAKALGFCSLRLKDLAAARRAFDQACTLAPGDAEAWHYSAVACIEEGEQAAGLARLERCLQIDPGFVAARVRAGAVLAELGRSSEALQILAPARRLPEAATLIGDCLERLGEGQAARTAWLGAVQSLQKGGDADRLRVAGLYTRLARSAWQSSAHADCAVYCREGLSRDESPMLRALLGASQMALGEVDRGRRLLQEVVDAHAGTEAGALAAASLAAAGGGQ